MNNSAFPTDPGRRRRRWLVAMLVAIPLLVGARIGAVVHNWGAGIGVGFATVAFWGALAIVVRRQGAAQVAQDATSGIPKVRGSLDFACLPGEWPQLARETLPAAAARNTPGLSVVIEAKDGWLQITKPMVRGTGRHPFAARVPLAAVRRVYATKARIGLFGSAVAFVLDDDKEVVVDTALDLTHAEQVAHRFEEAASGARVGPVVGPNELVVTSQPPPARTSPGLAGVLLMAAFPPFAIAMAGAPDGPFADVAASLLLFAALGLMMWRRPSMPRVLAKFSVIAGAAFVLDAVRTGQPLRLVGTVVSLAIARWMSMKVPALPKDPGHGSTSR